MGTGTITSTNKKENKIDIQAANKYEEDVRNRCVRFYSHDEVKEMLKTSSR